MRNSTFFPQLPKTSLGRQLSLSAFVGASPDTVFVSPETFAAVGNNVADDTAAWQNMLNSAPTRPLYVVCQPGKTYRVTNTLVFGSVRTAIEWNGSKMRADFGLNYSRVLFSNNKVTNASCLVFMQSPNITGNCWFIDLRFSVANPPAGMSLFLNDLYYNSMDGNRREGTGLFRLAQVDFVDVRKVEAWNFDLGIDLGSLSPERNCTQIEFTNLSTNQCRAAARIRGTSKARINGMDIMKCNSGFSFEGENALIELKHCHVEGLAMDGYQLTSSSVSAESHGVAFSFIDDAQAKSVVLSQCDTIDLGGSGGTAVASLRVGKTVSAAPYNHNIKLDNDCSFALNMSESANYQPIRNRGKMKWVGPWRFENFSPPPNGLADLDFDIEDTMHNPMPYIPLLGGNTVLSLRNGVGAGLAPTITPTSRGTVAREFAHRVTFNSAPYDLVTTVNLPYGWITIDFQGYRITGNPVIVVRMVGSPFTDLLRVQFSSLNDRPRRQRLLFWNNAPNLNCYVGITNQAADDECLIYRFDCYSGLPKRDIPEPDMQVVSALPAAESRWHGKKFVVRQSGQNDTLHVCLRDAASAFVFRQVDAV